METYTLYYDQKITTWERSTFNIEAESEEEAKDKLLALIDEDNQYEDENGFMGTETLYDCNTYLNPSENNHEPTEEITGDTGTIWDNGSEEPTISADC